MSATPFLSLPVVVPFAGIVLGLFLSVVLLFYRKGNRRANICLAAFVFATVTCLAQTWALASHSYTFFPRLLAVLRGGEFLLGPLIWFYVSFALNRKRAFKLTDALHFIPYLIDVTSEYRMVLNPEESIAVFDILKNYRGGGFLLFTHIIIRLAHILTYLAFSLRLLRRQHEWLGAVRNNFRLEQAMRLFHGYAVIVAISFAGYVLTTFTNGFFFKADAFFGMTFSMTILAIGFLMFESPELLLVVHSRSIGKYRSSKLPARRSRMLIKRVRQAMVREKLYLNPELTLSSLAEELSTTPHRLSQVINENEAIHFNTFVNRFRVIAAKRILSDPNCRHHTILRVAYDVGFNNKVSFNRAFKQTTGLTPREFRSSIEASSHRLLG